MATKETAPNGDSIVRVSNQELGILIWALQELRDGNTQKDAEGKPIVDSEMQMAIDLLAVIQAGATF
jgi:hypothetical protein